MVSHPSTDWDHHCLTSLLINGSVRLLVQFLLDKTVNLWIHGLNTRNIIYKKRREIETSLF